MDFVALTKLLELMRSLRDNKTGCPWTREQNFRTIVPYTLEEAYEVAETIEQDDLEQLLPELGDLLFQIIFYAQLAAEQNLFNFHSVCDVLYEKLESRTEKIRANNDKLDAKQANALWEQQKKHEQPKQSILDDIAQNLPALTRAVKLQNRAAEIGFDWPDVQPVFAKLAEEIDELKAELPHPENRERIMEEYGDLLFACSNLARHLNLDPEASLRAANRKFEKRFQQVEQDLKQRGLAGQKVELELLDEIWEQIKK